SPGRNAIHSDLSVEPTRHDVVKLIILSGWYVHFTCSVTHSQFTRAFRFTPGGDSNQSAHYERNREPECCLHMFDCMFCVYSSPSFLRMNSSTSRASPTETF